MEQRKMNNAVLLGLLAVVLITPAAMMKEWPWLLRVTLAAAGVMLFFYAALITIAWLRFESDQHAWREARAAALTVETETLRIFAQLQPYQVEAYLKYAAVIVAVPGVAGATLEYKLGKNEQGRDLFVPADFVREFLEQCGEEYLFPVRRYAEGTRERDHATIITDYLVERGLAYPSVSKFPARWKAARSDVLRQFNLIEEV